MDTILKCLCDPSAVLVAVLVVLATWYVFGRKTIKYPPGPRPWPIVGNIPQILNFKKDIYEVALILRKQYGDIVRLRMGPQNVIIILGSDKIHKAALHPKLKYRPTRAFLVKHIFKERGLIFGNGEMHSSLRKFAFGALREFGVGKRTIEERIQEEATILTESMEKQNGVPCNYLETYKMAVCNVIASIVYGNRLGNGSPEFTQLITDIDTLFKDTSLVLPENFFPFLRFLPGSKMMNIVQIFKRLEKYARGRIEEHRQSYDPDNIRDFVDLFIKHETTEDGFLNEDNMFRSIIDLFNAGTDTTATTLTWAVLHLIRNPDVQKKCREEVMRVVGNGRLIKLEDKHNMPYLQAFMNEVFRFSTIAPHTVPHTAIEDIEFEGYTIPKDSVVVFNLYSMLMDKSAWKDPEVFRPERFLTPTGELCETKDEFAPFSLGPRSCLGKHLSRIEFYLFIGILIQRFEFKSPPGSPVPSVARYASGITCRPGDYEVCAVPIRD